jgi:hypothetical protein
MPRTKDTPNGMAAALMGGDTAVLTDFLEAALRLQEAVGSLPAARIMREAAKIAEAAAKNEPLRERGRPQGRKSYCPYELALVMLAAESPEPPPQMTEESRSEARAALDCVAVELPTRRGSGRKRLAFVLHHFYRGHYGNTEAAIVQRMKEVAPLLSSLKRGDADTWQAAIAASEQWRRIKR